MPLSDPRSYSRLTAALKDHTRREVALYRALMDRVRLGRGETMQISELMTQEVEIIDPEATLQEAAQRMQAFNVRALPVGERDALVGMLTDRDLVTRAITEGRDPKTTRVREVMTPDLVTCFADQEITAATQLMHERHLQQLVVLSRDHRLVGIIALRDVPTPITVESLTGAATRSGLTIRWPI